jgi:DNA polymerase II large subunit
MKDKVDKQGKLQKRIRAVDEKDALERLLQYHLFPDIIGNTRAFARQKLRCVKCNSKYRRIPLSGKCDCGGKLILTIAEGSIKKYVELAKSIIKDYDLKPYLYQKVILSEEEIKSLFLDKEKEKQKSLSDFF